MNSSPFAFGESAVPLQDVEAYRQGLLKMHDAFVSGGQLPASPREVVRRSWVRMQNCQISSQMPVPTYDPRALDRYLEAGHHDAGIDFVKIIDFLDLQLTPIIADTSLVGVLTTADSRVIRRFGSTGSLTLADNLGLVYGAHWGEVTVGTNAIGTAAFTGQPVQIYGAEHWCASQHEWSCAASPLRDPRRGRTVAVLDISGPLHDAHPALLGYVHALTAQIELQLRESQRRSLERLRSREWSALKGLSGPWVMTDEFGAVAAVSGLSVPDRISDGERLVPGERVLPGLGAVEVARMGEGFLLRPLSAGEHPSYALNLATGNLELSLAGEKHFYKLSPKHQSVVRLLASSDGALSLGDIAGEIWGTESVASRSTIRAEMSRLRKRFPELVSQAPYRLLEPVELF